MIVNKVEHIPGINRVEQVAHLQRDMVMNFFASTATGAGLLLIFWNVTPVAPMIWWAVALQVANFFGLAQALAYKTDKRLLSPDRWLMLIVAYAVIDGLAWGASSWVFFRYDHPHYNLVLLAVLLGVSTSAPSSMQASLAAAISFILCLCLPLAVRLFLVGEWIYLVLGALLVLVYIGVVIQSTYRSHRALRESWAFRDQSRRSEGRLLDAIDSGNAGIAMFDENDRLVAWNTAYEGFFEPIRDAINEGNSYEQILRTAVDRGIYAGTAENTAAWIEERLHQHRHPNGPVELQLADGRWLLKSERKTAEGDTIGIFVNITRLKFIESELREAKDQAEAANRAKSDFLSAMSHELRTPMNAILGFTQIMQHDQTHPVHDQHREWLDHMMSGGLHLLELIDDVLDLAKVESGKLDLKLVAIPLRPLLADCIALTEGAAKDRGIRIDSWGIELQDEAIHADPVRMKQAILNLLSNAVKYNVEGGLISMAAKIEPDGMVRIAIRDTGIGIPEKDRARVFEPFTRIGRSQTEVKGTGIGLSITKQLIEKMGGSIGFESREGRGSTFWLRVPLDKADAAGMKTPDQPDRTGMAPPAAPTRVMYVEDDPSSATLMQRLLEKYDDTDLVLAQSAEDGLERLKTSPVDIVLMDVTLPGIDGVEATRRIKTDPATSDIPILLLSANAMDTDVQRGLAAGAEGYLTKPLNVQGFLETFGKVLAAGRTVKPAGQ